jgi:hypothetical protein
MLPSQNNGLHRQKSVGMERQKSSLVVGQWWPGRSIKGRENAILLRIFSR